MKRLFLLTCFSFLHVLAFAQKAKADSLNRLLAIEKIDSNKVNLMWKIANVSSIYDPENALLLANEAFTLAKRIKYEEGQSRSLGILANTYVNIGNYPRALQFNLQKLQIEERRNNPVNLASVLLNIGVVYVYQEEYHKALEYYYKSDSVIENNNINDFRYNISLSLGDVYDRLNIPDSAYFYFQKSLNIAKKLKDGYLIGASMTGMGHTYLKLEDYSQAMFNYQSGISYLRAANDDDLLCEATLGLAKLYKKINIIDSAVYYAKMSISIAEKGGFLPRHLDAANFLTDLYKDTKNVDRAFFYLNYVKVLNDSINSKSSIRESQILSSNEQLRQLEIEESKRIAQQERVQQLQMLFIGIFIPGFFLLTLLLSRIKIHVRVIKVLGILSLLILFEYLTLLLHPYVKAWTHHTPVYEMLIFVSIAAILIPSHHRIEHWLILKLTKSKTVRDINKIKSQTIRLKINK